MWYDICVTFVCCVCVSVCARLYWIAYIPSSFSRQENIPTILLFGQSFLYFLAITIGGEKFCTYIFLELFARFSRTRSPHSFCLPLFLFRSLDADIINIRSVICFPEVFYAVLFICVLFFYQRTDWFIVCLSVSFYFVLLSFVCSYMYILW